MVGKVLYKDLGDSILLRLHGRSPKMRIVDILLAFPLFDFNKEELARELGMSKQTLYKAFRDLEELGVVVKGRRIGRATMYRINLRNPGVRKLNEQVKAFSLGIAERELERLEALRRAKPGGRHLEVPAQ